MNVFSLLARGETRPRGRKHRKGVVRSMLTGTLIATGLAVASTGASAATASWTQLSPTTSPPAAGLSSMVYHPGVGLVLFGGENSTGNGVGDTWVYDGTTWTDQIPTSASTPAPRINTTMAYDAARGETVLFGGYDGSGVRADTWTFDGTAWTQEAPANSPPARDSAMMAYDASTQQVVLYGGWSSPNHLSDTWTWNGSTWTEVTGTAPPARYNGSMAYHPASGDVVLFGGSGQTTYLADTWTFDGSAWTEETPANSPTARAYAAMAYYPAATSLVLTGGISESGDTVFADTWTYDGTNWAQQAVTAPARTYAVAALHEASGNVVLFGGSDELLQRSNDTWSYGASSAPPSAPSAPDTPGVEAGDGLVTLSWTEPEDGGSAITGYTVAYRPTGAKGNRWSTMATTDTSAVVLGLTNNTEYAFKVLATNAIGDSPYSAVATGTPLATGAPGQPTGLQATSQPGTDGRSVDVTLTWTANGFTATDHEVVVYSYRMSSKGVATYRAISRVLTASADNTYVVPGLSASKVYAFTVTAGNTAGWSLPSAYSDPLGG